MAILCLLQNGLGNKQNSILMASFLLTLFFFFFTMHLTSAHRCATGVSSNKKAFPIIVRTKKREKYCINTNFTIKTFFVFQNKTSFTRNPNKKKIRQRMFFLHLQVGKQTKVDGKGITESTSGWLGFLLPCTVNKSLEESKVLCQPHYQRLPSPKIKRRLQTTSFVVTRL